MDNAKLQKAAALGLDRLTEYLEKVGRGAKISDEERNAAKLGQGIVSTAVRAASSETNRMMVELARDRWAIASAPKKPSALPRAS